MMFSTRVLPDSGGFRTDFKMPEVLRCIALVSVCTSCLSSPAQWTLTAIHPDPTPYLGAPEAEFIALVASGSADSCISSSGWSLSWNGNVRFLPEECWGPGTILVAHRAADSGAFAFTNEIPVPLPSWPALVNAGGTVSVVSPSGKVQDAMPYNEKCLGGGGRPLLRADTAACGGQSNQRLWEFGFSPFMHLSETHWPGQETPEVALQRAREPGRLVPRGAGSLDWFLGSDFDPVETMESKAWVNGLEATVVWISDTVASLRWHERTAPAAGVDSVRVMLGPLRSCPPGSRKRMYTSGFQRMPTDGDVEFTGIWPDPVVGDPLHPMESFSLQNVSDRPIDLGGWWFGQAQLKRRTVLEPGESREMKSDAFTGWQFLPNEGGAFEIWSHMGQLKAEAAWSPCDHDFPVYAGSGLGLVRSPAKGSAWNTEGAALPMDGEQSPEMKGFGCVVDFNGQPNGLDIHLNRYVGQLPNQEWRIDGNELQGVTTSRIPSEPQTLRLSWEGMQEDLTWPSSAVVRWDIADLGIHSERRVQCPPVQAEAAPCLRITEMMWDAAEDGDEFVEIANCGSQPVDLAGLQAAVKADPFPSDWRFWRMPNESLILAPGGVVAFGRCPKWMGNGLPNRGTARWSAAEWSALSDSEGQLALRLSGAGMDILDSVRWDSDLEGPWWWSPDGWAWTRSGPGSRDWVPSPDRGSPGQMEAMQWTGNCSEAIRVKSLEEGRLSELSWSFPEAGATLEIRWVRWPSGSLSRRVILEDLQTEGKWSGWLPSVSRSLGGQSLLVLRWWSPTCSGKRIFRLHDFRSG